MQLDWAEQAGFQQRGILGEGRDVRPCELLPLGKKSVTDQPVGPQVGDLYFKLIFPGPDGVGDIGSEGNLP